MKSNINSLSYTAIATLKADEQLVKGTAVEIAKLLSEKGLNYRQAMVVLELVQAEIKECSFTY